MCQAVVRSSLQVTRVTSSWLRQVVAFLEKLGQLRGLQPLHSSTSRKLVELYRLDASQNAEIRAAWYKLAINAGALPKNSRFGIPSPAPRAHRRRCR